jgi:nitrate reductase gamma subunit
VRTLRRIGIAIGSLVAAWLVLALVGSWFLPFLGVSYHPTDPGATPAGSAVVGIVTIALGGLIYRDIMRREPPGA